MSKLSQLLNEKDIKTLENAKKKQSKNDWKVAQLLFDNLLRKATKMGCTLDLKTSTTIVKGKSAIYPIEFITKTKIVRIRLSAVGLQSHGVSWSVDPLWVKPVIQNNRMKLFWKGVYIEASSIFGESINRYQD